MANPKLTPDQNAEIVRRFHEDKPTPTQAALATEYGVTESTISRLLAKAKPVAVPVPSALSTAPHNHIFPSPLNPRKRFDPTKQAELTESLRKEGILLPLLVRKANQPGNTPVPGATPDDLEVIAGERRWRSAAALVTEGVWPVDYPVHTKLVDPCDDLKLLQLAYTENVARQDMTALEEAEAIAAMQKFGASAAQAAETMGLNKRTAQKRLRLLNDTTPRIREALDEGKISTEFANVLAAYCPKSQQNATLEEIVQGRFRTTEILKSQILATRIPAGAALFDLSAYNGGWVEDEEKPDERYFVDTAQFKSLQHKALNHKLTELGSRYAWVRVFDEAAGEIFRQWQYSVKPGHAKAGAVIVLEKRMAASIKLDLVEDNVLQAENSAITKVRSDNAPAAAPEPTTKAHNSHAHKRKTETLQIAIAAEPMMAMRLTIMGLLEAQNAVRIKPDLHPSGGDFCISPSVSEVVVSFIPALQSASNDVLTVNKQGALGYASTTSMAHYHIAWNQAALWTALVALPDDDTTRLFAALVALRCGSFDGYDPHLGDNAAALAIADTLGLVGNEADHGLSLQAEDLEGLRKDTLLTIARAVGTRDANKLKTADLKAQILDDAPADCVLPSLHFGGEDDIKLRLQGRPAPLGASKAPATTAPQDDIPDEDDDGSDIEADEDRPVHTSFQINCAFVKFSNSVRLNKPHLSAQVRERFRRGVSILSDMPEQMIADDYAMTEDNLNNLRVTYILFELFALELPEATNAEVKTLRKAIDLVCLSLGITTILAAE